MILVMQLRNLASICAVAMAIVGLGCQPGSAAGSTIDPSSSLTDVNTSSETFDQPLHPADYEGMISAWYFGHAT